MMPNFGLFGWKIGKTIENKWMIKQWEDKKIIITCFPWCVLVEMMEKWEDKNTCKFVLFG